MKGVACDDLGFGHARPLSQKATAIKEALIRGRKLDMLLPLAWGLFLFEVCLSPFLKSQSD